MPVPDLPEPPDLPDLPDLIILDLGNVIVDVRFERFVEAIAPLVPGRAAEEIDARFHDESPLKLAFMRGEVSAGEFMADALAWLDEPSLTPEVFAEAWSDIFSPTPGAVDFIEARAGRSEIWLLSDTDALHYPWIRERFPIVERLDRILLSYERGLLKRDPGGFAPLVEAARSGREVVFADDLEVNVRAARDAGIRAVLFRDWADAAPQIG